MTDFESMKPPDNLVSAMIKEVLSEAWAVCPNVIQAKDLSLICGGTKQRCFVFQDGKDCKNNPLNKE